MKSNVSEKPSEEKLQLQVEAFSSLVQILDSLEPRYALKKTNSYLYCLTGIQNFIAFPNCHTQRSNVKLAIVERVET